MPVKFAGRLADRPTIACAALLAMLVVGAPHSARAQTLPEALALAYMNNPSLNSQRAILRQNDEGVPQALSGYRPTPHRARPRSASSICRRRRTAAAGGGTTQRQQHAALDAAAGTQTLYNGKSPPTQVRQAESQVWAASETLRCHRAAGAARLRDRVYEPAARQALLELQRRNVEVLTNS